MATIRNTNERFGDAIEFTGRTIEDAVAQMQSAIRACGPDFVGAVVQDGDYEIVTEEPRYSRIEVYDHTSTDDTDWYYSAHEGNGVDHGVACGADLDAAIEDTVRQLGMDLTPDDFGRDYSSGYAIWDSAEDPGEFVG